MPNTIAVKRIIGKKASLLPLFDRQKIGASERLKNWLAA